LKKSVLVAFCMLTLLLLTCLTASKPAHAQEAGYSHMCYETSTTPTINGQWSSEWTSGLQTTFGANANFTDEWYLAATSPSTVVYYYHLIETMDNTNDTGDFIQICFDGGMTADSAPSSTDFAINFTDNTYCTWYKGNGAGWTQIATPSLSDFQWNESFSSSPKYSTPHLILEMSLLKTSTDLGGTQIIGPEFWMLIETYDANSAGYGLQSWPTVPPSSPDVPSTYGDIPYTAGVAPTPTPTPGPTAAPTAAPTPQPTAKPTTSPTASPAPTAKPTATPTPSPSPTPTSAAGNPQDVIYGIVVATVVVGIATVVLMLRKRSSKS
jgi:hypothetical protein